MADGLTNRDVAARLFLSVRTVEVHVDHVLTKFGFHSRGQLIPCGVAGSTGERTGRRAACHMRVASNSSGVR